MPDELLDKKSETWPMFDRIARRYDRVNQILSLGMHKRWRQALVRLATGTGSCPATLDMATGTGDVVLALAKSGPADGLYYGLDLSGQMLTLARRKIIKQNLFSKIQLLKADAAKTSFPDKSFDRITMAFGIRNVTQPLSVLKEMHRLLRGNGQAFILEFSLPENRLVRFFALIYLRVFVLIVGGLISWDWSAYRYLTKSIMAFPSPENFCALMKKAEFCDVKVHQLCFGIASIYEGKK